jgi:hypothetical protein
MMTNSSGITTTNSSGITDRTSYVITTTNYSSEKCDVAPKLVSGQNFGGEWEKERTGFLFLTAGILECESLYGPNPRSLSVLHRILFTPVYQRRACLLSPSVRYGLSSSLRSVKTFIPSPPQ